MTVFKCIYNFNDVPDLWKEIFETKTTRNGLILNISKIRFKFLDKNFFINAMKLFISLPIFIRNETNLSVFLQNVKKFLSKNISSNQCTNKGNKNEAVFYLSTVKNHEQLVKEKSDQGFSNH